MNKYLVSTNIKHKMKKRSFILIIVTVLFLLLAYSLMEPYWLEVKSIDIIDQDIPKSFDGKKIVFVSDIHHGPYFSIERVNELVEKINGVNPDIIILGGDYVRQDSRYIAPVFEELKNLNATIGKFGVLGNHDHWEGAELTRQGMKNAGIKILDNNAEWISINGEKIKVGGVGDLWTDLQDMNPTINDTKEEDFVILVSHNPDYAEEIKTDKIDLVLSGHTHGGQVTLFGLWAPSIPSRYGQKYRTGIVDTKFTKVVISNGVGMVGLPVRFFARPEIIIIILKSE